MSGYRVLIEELWKPAQPQSEQRQLIPRDSFFLFLCRLSGKTIFSESHSGQRSIFPGMKVVSTDSQGTCNDLDDLVHSKKEEAGLKQQIEQLGETLRRGRQRKIPITKA
jgi:hypothetical protein